MEYEFIENKINESYESKVDKKTYFVNFRAKAVKRTIRNRKLKIAFTKNNIWNF